jgi:aminopeptidase N
MKKLFYILAFICNVSYTYAQIPEHECATGKILALQKRQQNERLASTQAADDNIDVTYYKLNLGLSYSPRNLKGEVTIYAKSKVSNLSQVHIDLQNTLTTDSIKIANKPVAFSHQNGQIKINLDKNYAENQTISLMIYYHGATSFTGLGSFIFGTHGTNSSDLAIWSLSEPYGSSDWFPCKNAVDDKADSSDVWITAEKYYVSVSNGILMKTIDNQDGTKTYQWKNRYPIAQYLISIACSNYTEYKGSFNYGGSNPMPITHYIYPESFTNTTKTALDKTAFMLDLFSKKFGLYPFIKEKYGHAQFGWGGGMEHQTCTSISSFGETLIAHELTHQWFGDKITCKNWENIWLNEGFASYGECIYTEAVSGKPAYDNYINGFMNSAKTARGTIYVQNVNDINEIFNSARTYRKGAVIIHSLRGIVGDDKFFKILQNYMASKNAYSNATIEDFQTIAEQVYGQSLDYFFKEWLYGENYPKYKSQWSAIPQSNGTFKVNVSLSQSTNTNPIFFTMPIQIKINQGLGDTTTTVFNNQQNQSFEFVVKQNPSDIVIDPNNLILKSLETLNILSNEPQIADSYALNIYPNPSSDEINVSYQLAKSSDIKLSIIDFSGKEIYVGEEEKQSQGNHLQNIKISQFSAGTYIVNLRVDGLNESRKLVTVK